MDREKKRTIALIVLIGVAILGAILYFIWGNFINKGKIKIVADPPFEVQIVEREDVECTVSPCEITQKTGTLDLIFTKDGYKTFSKEVEVNLFKTTELNIEFEAIPYILKTESIPEPEKEINYEIVFDEENQMFKLVNSDDSLKRTIVFFQKEIKDPLIFGSEKAALIIDRSSGEKIAYRVDTVTKSREGITDFDFKNIIEGKWSNDGENFVFITRDSDYLWLINSDNGIKQLSILKENSKYAWISLGSLVFITQQGTTIAEKEGEYSDYVEVMPEKSGLGYMFGQYHPDENSYTKIKDFSFSEIPELPLFFIPAGNGKIIYFQVGEEKYKLIF
jgi:hypothetical protein